MNHDEKTPALGTELPQPHSRRHKLTPEDRRKGTASRVQAQRAGNTGPKIEKVQPAPYEPYTEVELVIRGRDGRERVLSPEGLSMGRIKGASTRRVSTSVGYMPAKERALLANHLTAFIRHVLEQRGRNRSIESIIEDAKQGMR